MARILRPRFGGGLSRRLARLEEDATRNAPPPDIPPFRRGWKHYGSPGIPAGWIDWEPKYGPWNAVWQLLNNITEALGTGGVVRGKDLDGWMEVYSEMMAGHPLPPLPKRQQNAKPTNEDWEAPLATDWDADF